jgi:hypothetical protein
MGVKWLGGEADYSPPSSDKVRNGGAIPSVLHMSSWHGAQLIKHGYNFAFIIPLTLRRMGKCNLRGSIKEMFFILCTMSVCSTWYSDHRG